MKIKVICSKCRKLRVIHFPTADDRHEADDQREEAARMREYYVCSDCVDK